jgi:hypothetical protein
MRTSENYERICLNKKKILLNFAFGQNVGEKNEAKDCNTYDMNPAYRVWICSVKNYYKIKYTPEKNVKNNLCTNTYRDRSTRKVKEDKLYVPFSFQNEKYLSQ